MDRLIFRYATMNSGKTMDLIIRAYNYEETGKKVFVMKPKIDTKGDNQIVSRTGLKRKVDYLIGKEDSILQLIKGNVSDLKCILVDEAQFLTAKQVEEFQLLAHTLKIDVVCYGLRDNFKMEAFEGSKRLFELADILEEQPSLCSCGEKARFVGRKVDGEYVFDGEEVVIDGTQNVEYVPLCGSCYLKKVKNVDFVKVKKKVTYGRRKSNYESSSRGR